MGDSRSQGSSTLQGGEEGSSPPPGQDCTCSAPEAAGPRHLLGEREGTGKEGLGEAEASPRGREGACRLAAVHVVGPLTFQGAFGAFGTGLATVTVVS